MLSPAQTSDLDQYIHNDLYMNMLSKSLTEFFHGPAQGPLFASCWRCRPKKIEVGNVDKRVDCFVSVGLFFPFIFF